MNQVRLKHTELELLIKKINQESSAFNNVVFFNEPSLEVSFNSFEVCFKDYVFYLYSIFVELPGVNLKFVDAKVRDFGMTVTPAGSKISRLVQDLRTVRGHFTTVEKPKDRDKRNACEDWYLTIAGTRKLEKEDEYRLCIHALLDNTIDYLHTILLCVRHFSTLEYPEIVRGAWEREIYRTFSKYEWELELIDVLEMYGMNHFDPHEIVEKQFSKWNARLKILQDGFVFREQAQRIIISYLEEEDIWPGTADDLHALGVPMGKEMGEAVRKAKTLYYNDPCTKEELMERFRKEYL